MRALAFALARQELYVMFKQMFSQPILLLGRLERTGVIGISAFKIVNVFSLTRPSF